MAVQRPGDPEVGAETSPGDSVRHVLGRVAVAELRVERYASHGGADAAALDGRLAQALSSGQADVAAVPGTSVREIARLLGKVESDADRAEARGSLLRLRRLRELFALTDLDLEILLLAMLPEMGGAAAITLAGLPESGSHGRLNPGLALRLCELPSVSAAARARLEGDAPLIVAGLVELHGEGLPWVVRPMHVPSRVVSHLLGSDPVDAEVRPYTVPFPGVMSPTAAALERLMRAGIPVIYVRDTRGGLGAGAAVHALDAIGFDAVVIDASRIPRGADVETIARAAARDAQLRGAGVVIDQLELLAERGADSVRAFAESGAVVVLVGSMPWDPAWALTPPALVEAEAVAPAVRADVWREAVGTEVAARIDLEAATAVFRLGPRQILSAARAAEQQAVLSGREIDVADLQAGARSQNAAGLDRLARRIMPKASWSDLVLPQDAEVQLRQLAIRWRQRDRVLDTWGMGRGVSRGRGVSALFAGDSGTGKTMSAEVIAGDLGLDLYVIDLSTVVDKYIGETSKNLERIFTEADRVNGVLLFDEADAIFGKRSGVSDSKDRHANVEVAYLLQRMEAFDGVAILTTNLATNLDEAFIRRLDAIIDFPSPDVAQRELLWRAKLRPSLPQADDLDVPFLAERFRMSGAEIQNAVVTAAYLAAEDDTVVGMRHLARGVLAEHRKMGRFLPDGEFGPYAPLLRDDAASEGRVAPHTGVELGSTSAGDGPATSAVAPVDRSRRAPRRVVSP
jgi:hypothetical protein